MSAPVALIMAGGTGGHVYPALALARELRNRSWQIVWLGTRRGLEARVVPAEQLPLEVLSVGGLRGKGLLTWLAAPFRLARSLSEALAVMRRHRPTVVVGLGGYVTGPGGVAAWLTRAPLLIHEQNAIAGFTNRCLARLAREVYAAFPDAFGSGVVAQVIGNPVRAEIAALPPPAERFALRSGAIRILVIGGSLGAARLNSRAAVCAGAARRPHRRRRAPPVGRTLDRGRAPRLRRRRASRRRCRRSSRTWPTATPGPTWSSAAPAR